MPSCEREQRNSDSNTIGKHLQVFVRDNNVEQALRVLKKKMQREGIFREMKRRKAYEKPSERKTREKAEAIRRGRKAARKQAQRDGLIPMPKRREDARRSYCAAQVVLRFLRRHAARLIARAPGDGTEWPPMARTRSADPRHRCPMTEVEQT